MARKTKLASMALTPQAWEKLEWIVQTLGVSRNEALNQLITNAEIRGVTRNEPVVALVVEKSDRQNVQLCSSGVLAVQ